MLPINGGVFLPLQKLGKLHFLEFYEYVLFRSFSSVLNTHSLFLELAGAREKNKSENQKSVPLKIEFLGFANFLRSV